MGAEPRSTYVQYSTVQYSTVGGRRVNQWPPRTVKVQYRMVSPRTGAAYRTVQYCRRRGRGKGAVQRWSGGAVEQWSSGAVGRWSSGTVVQAYIAGGWVGSWWRAGAAGVRSGTVGVLMRQVPSSVSHETTKHPPHHQIRYRCTFITHHACIHPHTHPCTPIIIINTYLPLLFTY